MIEAMSHVAVVADAARRAEVLDWLYKAKALHVLPFPEDDAEQAAAWGKVFRPCPETTGEIESRVAQLSAAVSFCHENRSCQPGFLDQLFPLKVVTSAREMDEAVAACDPEKLSAAFAGRRAELDAAREKTARLELRREQLRQFAFLGDALPALPKLKNVLFRVVAAQGEGEKGFLKDERVGREVAADALKVDGPVTYYGLAAAAADRAVFDSLIEEHGLHVVTPPEAERPAGAELVAVEAEIASAGVEFAAARAAATSFADAWDRKAEIALGFWESEKTRRQEQPRMAVGEHLFAARGYLRDKDLPGLRADLDKRFGGAAAIEVCAAPEGEDPPTSLVWNKAIRPASLLVKMYGLPSYRGIDPTPCVATIFFFFVGMCLGDAVYGLMLIAAMLWLKRRYRDQKGLQDFFNLFVYSGASAVLFGILTGSFFADLTAYLAKAVPALKPIDDLRVTLCQIDPIANAQTALYIAIGIGVFSQFYGLILRIYRDARRGDYMGAFSDGFLWLLFLGSLVGFGLAKTGVLPGGLATPCLVVVFLAVLGLVLTQGRENANWGLRLMVGVISLYGIVGAYGISAFLGDVISYARLMALALTSAALGSTFNMLAELAASLGVIGVVLAVLVVIGGHIMNFALSILSAFVHSARLVMLEYFGRFYEPGGYAYTPHGFSHPVVEVDEEVAGR